MSNAEFVLPGQDTLLASWEALAQTSSGARILRSSTSVAAVFPAWEPLNNAIVLSADTGAVPPTVVSEVASVYAGSGVEAWALWVPSRATSLEAPDEVRAIDRLKRDTTTLVMHAPLRPGLRLHDGVVRASLAAATRAGEEPVRATDLGAPETVPGLDAWVMVQGDVAVASGWTVRHRTDCGIYAVGTVSGWRRRGLATALVQHVLAIAEQDGARTATLQSTRMAQRLYESLGFVAVGRYEEWVSPRVDAD